MTVKELRQELDRLPPDAIVILQEDAEGNGYSPVSGVQKAFYVKENSYSGEVYDTEEEAKEGIDDDVKLQECVVIWPIN